MHHKIIENWIAFVAGVAGYGYTYLNIHLFSADAVRFLISIVSAALAGGAGYLGKLGMIWALRKFKLFIIRLKAKK